MTALLTTLAAGAGPQKTLAQSAQAIAGWVSWISSQSSAAGGSQAATVDAVKAHASLWYNQIYPTYLDLPDSLARLGSQIDGDLQTMIGLAAQWQAQPSAAGALKPVINSYASNLLGAAQSIAERTQGLAGDLHTFVTNLQMDIGAISRSVAELTTDQSAYSLQLNVLHGQLHQLKSATCPNSGAIEKCAAAIGSETPKLDAVNGALAFFRRIQDHLYESVGAATYLSAYWNQVSTDATQSVQSLQDLLGDPVLIVKLQLTTAQANWNALVQTWEVTGLTLAQRTP